VKGKGTKTKKWGESKTNAGRRRQLCGTGTTKINGETEGVKGGERNEWRKDLGIKRGTSKKNERKVPL